MRSPFVPALVLLLSACSESPAPKPPPAASGAALAMVEGRELDPARVRLGGELYRQHCAVCHGDCAQGAPNWHRRGADGRFPPPPLDASGHAWHHPRSWLVRRIRQGTLGSGGAMPGWEDKLAEEDIDAIVAWIQSLWPAEIYAEWERIDRSAGAAR